MFEKKAKSSPPDPFTCHGHAVSDQAIDLRKATSPQDVTATIDCEEKGPATLKANVYTCLVIVG